jgi:Rieske Fe-S protein
MKTATSLRRFLLTLTTGATGAVFALAPTMATAANSQSFQISPPTANYSADKGTAQSGTVKVTNLTNQPIALNVGKENFVAKGEEGETELSDNADPLYSLAPWFSVDTNQITVPGLGTQVVHYTIALPSDAEPGGRYGSITFNSIPPKLPSGQSGAAVEQTIGNLVFLRINGPAQEQLNVETFETGHLGDKNSWAASSFFQHGPVDFLTRVKNTGNVHEKPTGTITIKNAFGFTVAKLPLDEHFVIPGAIRRLHNSWANGAKKPFLLGPYSATLDAKYDGGKTLTATTHFTVIPLAQVAIVLIILILLVLFFWKGRKRMARALRILAGKE